MKEKRGVSWAELVEQNPTLRECPFSINELFKAGYTCEDLCWEDFSYE